MGGCARVVAEVDGSQTDLGGQAALQPTWVGADELLYLDNPSGRWNLHRAPAHVDADAAPIAPADADTGGGLWVLGNRWYGALDDGRVVAVRTNGTDELVLIDDLHAAEPTVHALDLPITGEASIDDVSGTWV